MKLQYKNNQWEDENGVPIAPNDQDSVQCYLWNNNKASILGVDPDMLYLEWQPEIGKLYDSGDLEFELKELVHCTGASWIEPKYCGTCKNTGCGCEVKQFWALKEKE